MISYLISIKQIHKITFQGDDSKTPLEIIRDDNIPILTLIK